MPLPGPNYNPSSLSSISQSSTTLRPLVQENTLYQISPLKLLSPLTMFRNTVARPLLRANQPLVATRSFSVAAVRMGEGDLGAPKAGGAASADSFTKREAAQENLYVREKELQKLRELKHKLAEQRKHLDELDKHIDQLTKEQGGEQN